MQKIILGLFMILLTVGSLNADNKKEMSDEEFMKQFMQLEERGNKAEKRIEEAQSKTKAVKQLGKTVDELAKKLGVDK